MAAPIYRHPDGEGSLQFDAATSRLFLFNAAEGLSAYALIGPWGLRDVAAKLMDGRLIDHPEFQDSTQSWRLGAVIFTLRALGWPVETIEVPSPTEHSPDRVIALYRLDGKYTAQALAMNGGAA